MKRTLLLAAALLMLVSAGAQTRTFRWQNTQRQYLMFEPSSRTGALPVMYFLHGLGDNITRCASDMNFASLANEYGWIILVPQAMSVQGSTMWNVGFGGTADDAGFFLALVDSLAGAGKVNTDSLFFTGFSMGGFMTHKMAIEHGDRINACAPVSGLITFALADEVPVAPVRMLHIHGTSDNVVGWNGGSSYFGNIGIGVDSIVNYWTSWNDCDNTPEVDSLPDRVNDGLSFVRYRYTGGDAEFQLIKVIGGSHDFYLDSTTHDIDYFDVIHKFFLGDGSSLGCNEPGEAAPRFDVWPNPASGCLYVRTSESIVLTLLDSRGYSVMQDDFEPGVTRVDVRNLAKGLYVLVDRSGASRKVVVI
ncbi:MAG: hypothetical protein II975_06895 [Bacteroidales bacterium]|nr:hypothetical protein [Bacteroidales bacterium]